MTIAIISDIHANLAALKAVLADIADHNVTQSYCLGDTVGYGARPVECLEQLANIPTILGNHDEAMVSDRDWPYWGNPYAQLCVLLHTAKLKDTADGHWLKKIKDPCTFASYRTERTATLTHASPSGDPEKRLNKYIFSKSDFYRRDLNGQKEHDAAVLEFKQWDEGRRHTICFVGHTHKPLIIAGDGTAPATEHKINFRSNAYGTAAESVHLTLKNDPHTIINVGSVGQPRDNDPRACYVLWDGKQSITYRRVPYNITDEIQALYGSLDTATALAQEVQLPLRKNEIITAMLRIRGGT